MVLVDRDTASASEIVTAALHERLGAPVVGRRTFGKGVFGQVFDLSNGGALDLIVGNYYTPNGQNLNGKGIRPDVPGGGQARRPRRDEALDRALDDAARAHGAAPAADARAAGPGGAAGRGASSGAAASRSWSRSSSAAADDRGRAPARREARSAISCWCDRRTTAAAAGAGEVVRALGRPDVPRDVVEALLADRGYDARLRRSGREGGAREAAAVAEDGPRRDLTALPTFTIDPASARDFDDAISAEPRRRRRAALRAHRRRVARSCDAGLSASTARRRSAATASTCPGTVEPMLPTALSSDACSLVPGVPTARPSRSRSRIDGAGERARRVLLPQPDPLRRAAHLRAGRPRLRRLASARRRRSPSRSRCARDGRGAACASGALGARGARGRDLRAGVRVRRRRARRRGARRRPDRGARADRAAHDPAPTSRSRCGSRPRRIPTIYRVHEQPDPAAVEFLVAQLESLDVPDAAAPQRTSRRARPGELVGRDQRHAARVPRRDGQARRHALTSLVLRSLKQAVYSPRNIGHAGLASAAYCHFTSPIRRYPDLVRPPRAAGGARADEQPPAAHELEEIAAHCTATEREAMAARARRRRHLPRVPARARADRARVGPRVRGRGHRRDRRRRVRELPLASEGGAACEGFLPGAPDRRRLVRPERGADRARRPARPGGVCAWATRSTVGVRSIEPARGRVDLEPAARSVRRRREQALEGRASRAVGHRHQPPGALPVPPAREVGGGHRAPGQRGQVAARRQGEPEGLLRGSCATARSGSTTCHIAPYAPAAARGPRPRAAAQAPAAQARRSSG